MEIPCPEWRTESLPAAPRSGYMLIQGACRGLAEGCEMNRSAVHKAVDVMVPKVGGLLTQSTIGYDTAPPRR